MNGAGTPLRVTVVSTLTGILTVSPVFLLGASGVLIREDLGFDESGLGNAVAVFFACGALASVPLGRLSERLGASRAMMLAAIGSAVSLLVIALGVRTYWALLLALALAGTANGMSQPSTALALVRGVPRRQGLVFGIKQASVPVTTLLAGISVPLLGVQVGWRWSFAIASLTALLVLAGIPRRISEPQPLRRGATRVPLRAGDAATAPLVLLAVGACLGNAAATAMAAFLVGSAVASGISVGVAGWLLAGGSVVGAVSRLAVGGLSDRLQGRALQLVAALLGFGSIGYLLIAAGGPLLIVGVAVAYGLAWGWPGTIMYAVTRLNQNAPGAAAGIVQVGASGGGVVGPPIFGLIVIRSGYTPAWLFAGTAAALACVNVLVARAWLRRDRHRREQVATATTPRATIPPRRCGMEELELYDWLAGVRADALAPETLERTAALVLDHLGCARLGRDRPWTRTVRDSVRARSPRMSRDGASVYGEPADLAPAAAAMINGTAAHATDFDDTHLRTMTHLGAVVIPAVLALAEAEDLEGPETLAAIVVGYEVAARAGLAIGLVPGERGLHGTSFYGVLGAAAAGAHLRGATGPQLRDAVGVAASFGSGIKAFQQGPGWVKRLHAGRAAEGGVTASDLALDGFRGPTAPLTGLYGFVRVFAHELTEEAVAALLEPHAAAWAVDEVYLKPYPACAAVHGAIAAAAALRAQGAPRPDDMTVIRLGVPQRVLHQNDIPRPEDALQAQYSAQHATALGLLGDEVDPAAYLDHLEERWATARALATRIEVELDESSEAAYPASTEAVLHVVTRDGEVLEQRGRSRPEEASGWEVAQAKFDRSAAPLLGDERARAVVEQVGALPKSGTSVRALLSALR